MQRAGATVESQSGMLDVLNMPLPSYNEDRSGLLQAYLDSHPQRPAPVALGIAARRLPSNAMRVSAGHVRHTLEGMHASEGDYRRPRPLHFAGHRS